MCNGNNQALNPVFSGSKSALRILAAISLALIAASSARALPLNGGFETGDFSNWNISIPTGISEFNSFGMPSPTVKPAGSAEVVTAWGPMGGMTDAVSAPEGSFFAALGSAGSACFQGANVYHITASQTFALNTGDTISSWALFFNGDYAAQDSAWVTVYDNTGATLTTVWSETSGGSGYQSATEWTQWLWQASTSGSYTVTYGVTTQGDDNFASFGLFDGLEVSSMTVVPEPSSTVLMGVALAGFVGFYRRSKK